ncbi:MAG: phosphohydrolase [Agathobacter sp.]|nr:phosphohydrolase [Agathobacter sp.]
MRFVKTEDLKAGMRLAKPIYNKDGVLLYERNSQLSTNGISSVKNFGLIGIYILEPAEPVPPLTEEDLEFEQLQTVYMFKLKECMDLIQKRQKLDPLYPFLQDIIKHYGSLDHRVNFNQNLRSGEDFMYKHAISTAILLAMMTSHIKFSPRKQMVVITAALLHTFGYIYVPKHILEKGPAITQDDQEVIWHALQRGLDRLSMYTNSYDFFPRAYALMQTFIHMDNPESHIAAPDPDLGVMVNMLKVAVRFDQLTAMSVGYEPVSEIMAMRDLMGAPDVYHPNNVTALAECIHIVPRAASVDLSSGDKGIILVENTSDFMRPVVLRLSDNQIFDLSNNAVYKEIQIVDIMKTMDNRIDVDEDTLKQFVPDAELSKMASRFRANLKRIHEREEREEWERRVGEKNNYDARA